MTKKMMTMSAVLLTLSLTLPSAAWAGGCGKSHASQTAHQPNLVEIAKSNGQFNTLLAAAQAAGLAETLASDGPFTIFAPTDAAFGKLPDGTVAALLKDPVKLRSILKYHVVQGELPASKVVAQQQLGTLLGRSLTVSTDDGVRIGNAMVTATDIRGRNGIIHVIDSVLLPENDLVDVAKSAGSFDTLLTALEAAGLTDALRADGPFTVFAPTDEAFAKLPEGTLQKLLNSPEQLRQVLTYHVVAGDWPATRVASARSVKSLQGSSIDIDTSQGVRVDKARVLKTDIQAGNGVIHVIDSVILPDVNSRT